MMAKDFAEALQQQIDGAGITAYRLSQMTGLSRPLLSKLLAGKIQPGWETVAKIAKALGVSCEVFITSDIELPEAPDAKDRGRPAKEPEPPAKPRKRKGKAG